MVAKATVAKVLKTLDESIIEVMNKYTLPGLALGVIHNGELVYAKGFGMADIEGEKEVSADTVFRIGSISKTFTTIGLLQLWEQGKFDLDDPVNEYLKTYQVLHDDPDAPPVTFRHMLTHTSGIGETRNIFSVFKSLIGKLEIAAEPDEPVAPLGEFYDGRLRAEIYPGEKWAYANHAYATLGQLIEDISGQPFEEYMIEHVFEPLGMKYTDYLLSERVMSEFAQGYNFKKGVFKPVPYQRIIIGAAGSIFSSVNEMAKYAAAIMNGGENEHGRVLKAETLNVMMESQLDIDPRVFDMGLTFWLEYFDKHLVVEHGGGWPGFISAFRVAPKDGLGVVAFTNCMSLAPDVLSKDIMYQLLGVPNPAENIPAPDIMKDVHNWPALCGFYGPKPGFLTNARHWVGSGGELEVHVNKENELALRSLAGQAAKGSTLHRSDPGDPLIYQAVLKEGMAAGRVITVLFGKNDDGDVDRLTTLQNTFYKRPFQQSVKFRTFMLAGALASLVLLLLGRKKMKKGASKDCKCKNCRC
ncbi:MAG: beta-lactamase family protein [Anaerolineaceae bacterium]|nr:beta-lactamase family protein [Anaerolineaceae bacterium]